MTSDDRSFVLCLGAAILAHGALLSLPLLGERAEIRQLSAIVFRFEVAASSAAPDRRHASKRLAPAETVVRQRRPAAESTSPSQAVARLDGRSRPEALQPIAPAEKSTAQPDAPPSVARIEQAERYASAARASYEQVVAAWLERHKYYPSAARRRHLQGESRLHISLNRDGSVASARVDPPGAHPILDQAALEMVERADPFPPVPEAVPGGDFAFVVPVAFRID